MLPFRELEPVPEEVEVSTIHSIFSVKFSAEAAVVAVFSKSFSAEAEVADSNADPICVMISKLLSKKLQPDWNAKYPFGGPFPAIVVREKGPSRDRRRAAVQLAAVADR